ncbi:DC-STAMP domain-containing protein 1 [Orchesella cincta]|uniref:DC-STAMP domain-containing protein 1 n=1 Tax=Orchesella cincta TaxID=48709 RepID=A0A1D2MNK6_ORCCI|nr:DC-STAMP domain-containing protein 1 [Orchesella cincta]
MVFTIFALDHIYTELLLLLQNHAEIQIKQEGVHVFAIQIKGEGFLAQLLRRVVKDFSTKKEIDMTHFTKPCLPIPKATARAYSQRVLILFSVLLANAYFQAHCARVKHCIADFFYKRRYKKRAVWLYNETLRRRRRKMAHLKRKVLENADSFRIYVPHNPFQLLSHFFPKACACLRRWKVGRRKCILCLANGALHHCPRCGFAYCAECFADVEQRCLLCIAERDEMIKRQSGDVTITNDDDVV